jgi:hypothetical protein
MCGYRQHRKWQQTHRTEGLSVDITKQRNKIKSSWWKFSTQRIKLLLMYGNNASSIILNMYQFAASTVTDVTESTTRNSNNVRMWCAAPDVLLTLIADGYYMCH